MKELEKFGLTTNEQKVYLSLLEIGSSQAGTIATHAKVHRRNTYDALARLVKKGLIFSVTKGKRKFYEALHPKRLVEIEQEKLSFAQQALPSLEKLYSATKSNQQVISLEGDEGMKNFFEDFTQDLNQKYILGATGIAYQKLTKVAPHLIKKMSKVKKFKMLWSADAIKRKEIDKVIKTESKTLPKQFSSPTQIFMYQDKTAIVIWSEKPIITIIQSKEVQSGFKKYFDFLWSVC